MKLLLETIAFVKKIRPQLKVALYCYPLRTNGGAKFGFRFGLLPWLMCVLWRLAVSGRIWARSNGGPAGPMLVPPRPARSHVARPGGASSGPTSVLEAPEPVQPRSQWENPACVAHFSRGKPPRPPTETHDFP